MQRIIKYFPDLSEVQIDQFSKLEKVYEHWNNQINVISRKDISELYIRHVLHSLAIIKQFSFKKGSRILDVGTGGGFPGIPLAIMFPEVDFHLVDAIGKKIKVVNSVAEEIGLTNVKGEQIRVEKLKGRYDFIVSRAVTNFPKFVKLVQKNISEKNINNFENGIIYLKGGDFQDEISEYQKVIKLYDIKDWFEEEFFDTKKLIYLPILQKRVKK